MKTNHDYQDFMEKEITFAYNYIRGKIEYCRGTPYISYEDEEGNTLFFDGHVAEIMLYDADQLYYGIGQNTYPECLGYILKPYVENNL